MGLQLSTSSAEIHLEEGTDETQLLQTAVHREHSSISHVERVAEAVRTTSMDAEYICIKAEAGDKAPFAGTFTLPSGRKVDVEDGDVAEESGNYCVKNSLVALLQRSSSLAHASTFEGVVSAKGDRGMGGKGDKCSASKRCV